MNRIASQIRRRAASWLVAGAVLTGLTFTVPASAQMASFDPATNVLTLDTLAAGGYYYTGVGIHLPPGQPWVLVGNPRMVNPLTASDAGVFLNGQLHLPRTRIQNAIYDRFVLDMPVGKAWSVSRWGDVVSISSPGYTEQSFPIRSSIRNSYEIDSGGELTYQLTNGMVFKYLVDEPCMVPGIGTSDPEGYSDVEIYPNPGASGSAAANEGNFRFVNYYPSKKEMTRLETCIVAPVSGVFGQNSVSSVNQLSAIPAQLAARMGEQRTFTISNGSPPYTVVIDQPGFADFWFQPDGRTVAVKFRRTGSGTLTVYDYNRTNVTVALSTTANALSLTPAALRLDPGTSRTVALNGGEPPYRLYHNPAAGYIDVGAITGSGTDADPGRVSITAVRYPPGGTANLIFVDNAGTLITLPVEVNAGIVTTTTFTIFPSRIATISGGQPIDISFRGGVPPYVLLDNPLPDCLRMGSIIDGGGGVWRGTLLVLATCPRRWNNVEVIFGDAAGTRAALTIESIEPSTGAAFAVSPASITNAQIGDVIYLALSGGVPPYMLYNNPSPQTVRVGSIPRPNGIEPASVALTILNSDWDKVPIVFADSVGTRISVEVNINKAPLTLSPGSINAQMGQTYRVAITGGVAPYRLLAISAPDIVQVGDIVQVAAGQAVVSVKLKRGDANAVSVTFIDSRNQTAVLTVTPQVSPVFK